MIDPTKIMSSGEITQSLSRPGTTSWFSNSTARKLKVNAEYALRLLPSHRDTLLETDIR